MSWMAALSLSRFHVKHRSLQHGSGEGLASKSRSKTLNAANRSRNLHIELWTSWASLLRSYAAAHGLNSTQHAVVEVSADEITLRVGSRWLRFTPNEVTASNHPPLAFQLNENGTATVDSTQQEMDLAAEQFAREILHEPQ